MVHAAPVVSFVNEANVAVTAGWSVTVSGVDFGFADATPTFGLGLSSCLTTAWASATSAVCLMALGNGPLTEALATVSTIVGTQTSVFSYDGMPTVTCAVGGRHCALCVMIRNHLLLTLELRGGIVSVSRDETCATCQRPLSASSARKMRRPVLDGA